MTASTLWDITETYLVAEHLELDDLEVTGNGTAKTIRVVIDGSDVDLERIAEVSRGLSRLLDAEYDTPGPYQLEVTSPGLERALKRPAHYAKSIGREVSVKARRADGVVATVKGVLTAVDDDHVTLDIEGDTRTLAFDDVIKARTVFRWNASPRPGR